MGAAISTISSNLPEMAKGVRLISALTQDEHDDRLLDATRRLCSAFSDLLNAAQPENKEVSAPEAFCFLIQKEKQTASALCTRVTRQERTTESVARRWAWRRHAGGIGDDLPPATSLKVIGNDSDGDRGAIRRFLHARRRRRRRRRFFFSLTSFFNQTTLRESEKCGNWHFERRGAC